MRFFWLLLIFDNLNKLDLHREKIVLRLGSINSITDIDTIVSNFLCQINISCIYFKYRTVYLRCWQLRRHTTHKCDVHTDKFTCTPSNDYILDYINICQIRTYLNYFVLRKHRSKLRFACLSRSLEFQICLQCLSLGLNRRCGACHKG